MTVEINGFAIEPSSSNRYLFRRVIEPRHEYVFEITSKRIVLRATLPQDVGINRGEALDDAERSEKDAQKAAQEFQRHISGSGPEGAAIMFELGATSATLAKLSSFFRQPGSMHRIH